MHMHGDIRGYMYLRVYEYVVPLCVCILIVTCAKVGKFRALGKIIDATEYYYYK